MKNIYSLLLAFVITTLSLAQVPQTMSYQAVIRDASGGLVTEQEIGMKISILQGTADGIEVYTETMTPSTNKNGLVSIEIGGEAGFADIDWSDGPYFLKTETDPEGGTSYTISGTNQLLTVPYALHAKTSGSSIPGPQGEQGLQGEAGEQGEAGVDGKSAYELWIDAGNTGTESEFIASLKGEKGDVGEQGIQGEPGAVGQQGDQGLQGADGVGGVTQVAASSILSLSGAGTVVNPYIIDATETDPLFTAWDKNYADLTNTPTTITTVQADEITANTAKVGITPAQATAISDNTAKTGITAQQASDITVNNAKVSAATGTATGEMQYWNGTAWVTVAVTENEGATLQMIGGVPTWTGGTPPTVPGAPTIGTAIAGDGQASVSFTAPASDGGSTIISYTAASSPGGITGTLTQAGSGTITVTGLTNGTAYTFTVTATNAIGTGAASAASNSITPVGLLTVTNPTTGEIWMDRNLGASQVATSSTDADAYGDLYQWGRGTDGHEKRTSVTTSTFSNSDTPGHGNFITRGSSPYDWRSPQNDNLWQGVSGTNNPCPSGYRLPTEAEWQAERASWSSDNSAGAFASPLKLPVAGRRFYSNGSLYDVGSYGYYWSSTVGGTGSRLLYFDSSAASMYSSNRAVGYSVRCLKD